MTSPLTIVLTNWKRPKSFLRVLDAVVGQTIRPQIFVWNNSPEPIDDRRITWRINSSQNRFCWPRWYMAAQAETPFVANIDDDLLPIDQRVLEDAVAVLERRSAQTIVGPYGRLLIEGMKFAQCPHVNPGAKDQSVDIVKGRLMVMRTERLRAIAPARPQAPPPLVQRCDDIILCGLMAQGRRRQHLVPASLRGRFRDLPQNHALSLQAGFYKLRHQAAEAFFDWRRP